MVNLSVHNAESIRITKRDYPNGDRSPDGNPFVVCTIYINLENGQQTEINVFGAPGLEVSL